jgi:hypothetical protein
MKILVIFMLYAKVIVAGLTMVEVLSEFLCLIFSIEEVRAIVQNGYFIISLLSFQDI